jgi:hypothetical protein
MQALNRLPCWLRQKVTGSSGFRDIKEFCLPVAVTLIPLGTAKHRIRAFMT